MKNKTYVYSMSFNTLIYYIFKKKKCFICGNKLIKIKKETYQGLKKRSANSILTTSTCPFYKEYKVDILYRCDNCNKIFKIEELTGEESDLNLRKKSYEEIRLSDEKIEKELIEYKRKSIYFMRIMYTFIFILSFLVLFLKRVLFSFLMIFLVGLIWMLITENTKKH